MITIRYAKKEDKKTIDKILVDLDLGHPNLNLAGFWVAEKEGKIIGIAHLQEERDFLFLSAVGVTEPERKRGIARLMLNKMLDGKKKPAYLYTVIPDFFKKLGFEIASKTPKLPPREIFTCEECTSDRCVTMVLTMAKNNQYYQAQSAVEGEAPSGFASGGGDASPLK